VFTADTLIPMTLLGVLRIPDGVVVASDGLGHNVGVEPDASTETVTEEVMVRDEVVKLRRIKQTSLVWGWSGDERPALEVGRWIENQPESDWDALSWDSLGAALKDVVTNCNMVAINKAQSDHVAFGLGNLPQGQWPLCEILIAGVLAGSADALHVNRRGDWQPMNPRPQMFVGSIPIQATTAWKTVRKFVEPDDPDTTENFRKFFEGFVSCAGTLGPPVSGWTINAGCDPEPFGMPEG
jgi:hypothetical protein